MTSFHRILVANRGEIACRVIRSVRELGMTAIAVYSDADAAAPHVKMADQALRIGPAPAAESYLDSKRILDAAKAGGAEAIHPGYGFLSENADFARACAEAGLVFIGPAAEAIELMGDKAEAKRRMSAAGVPCVPGYHGEDSSDEALLAAAGDLGFPILVKAAAGGGGRGMRRVGNARELESALGIARAEAESAFGSGKLILERVIDRARHVEIQIFADRHGGVVHLGERDCSVQRRHQKIIEEAPCPVLDLDLRGAMGAAAVKAARSIDYLGAGTVEFLLDAERAFYFLEMNTRLQVEHPVTEMITGLDLVALQIRVAQGAPMDLVQDDIDIDGHALEARLYAEDPARDFLPASGRIDRWAPAGGEGLRVDAGIVDGSEVSAYYDPLLAKMIARGSSREQARRRLIRALKGTALFGVKTNKAFLTAALEHPRFIDGEATTAFIGESLHLAASTCLPSRSDAAAGAVVQYELARSAAHDASLRVPGALLNWNSASRIETPYRFAAGEEFIDVLVAPTGLASYRVRGVDGDVAVSVLERGAHRAVLDVGGVRQSVLFNRPPGGPDQGVLQMSIDGRDLTLNNLNAMMTRSEDALDRGTVGAPMHGILLEVPVEPGQSVGKGERVAVLEAMKMQHEVLAPANGTIGKIHFTAGAQVSAGAVLMEFAPEE